MSRNYRGDRPGGGGRGRYDDRGGGRGRGRGGGGYQRRPTECNVTVNYNSLSILDNSKEVDICVYRVAIKSASYRIQQDEAGNKKTNPDTGEFLRDWNTRSNTVMEADEKFQKRFYSSMKPWRIYKELVRDQQQKIPKFHLDYDGREMALAPSDCGPGEDVSVYRVKIKRDCETDHPNSDKVKNEWFEVTLTKTHTIPSSDLKASIEGGGARAITAELSTAINVIMKSVGVKQGMLQLESQSSSLFFPFPEQADMFRGRMIETVMKNPRKKVLLSGIKQTAVFSSRGCNIQSDPIVQWADKEIYDFRNNESKIPIIDRRESEIAGVKVNFRDLGSNVHAQGIVEAALKKMMPFNFEYKIQKPNSQKEEAMLKRGKTVADVNDSRRRVFMNQSLKPDPDTKEKIKWSPDAHSFRKGEIMTTVTEHYRDSYGISLDVNLPIVFLGKFIGWLPLEFAYQSLAKTKDANESDMVSAVLKYYDNIAGTQMVGDMTDKRKRISSLSCSSLEKYNLSIKNEPTKLNAKILRPPAIQFGRDCKTPSDGSWSLHHSQFAAPATMYSFAVVDFSEHRTSGAYVPLQLRINEKHGIEIPRQTFDVGRNNLNSVTEYCFTKYCEDHAPEATRRAIDKARDVFLNDSLNIYGDNRYPSWHKTTCTVGGNSIKCLVLPPDTRQNPECIVGLMFEKKNQFDNDAILKHHCTHEVTLKDGRVCDRTRLKIKMKGGKYIDPFEVDSRNGVDFIGYTFECHLTNGRTVHVDMEEMQNVNVLHKETDLETRIHCPSIILEILPTSGKALYDTVKSLTNNTIGVQTQCIDVTKFEAQVGNRQDQYASNIAMKINTKLSDRITKAEAWQSSMTENSVGGIEWVVDCPTLVIGIGLVHGMGFNAETVVSAFTCLDSQCMRFASSAYLQKKSDLVYKYTMMDIIKDAWDKYCDDNRMTSTDPSPQRDGTSDGNFKRMDKEIDYIREAIKSKTSVSCSCDCGCKICCPPITFVICQSQNNTRVVPTTANDGRETRNSTNVYRCNVYSGTVVDDDLVLELGTLLSISENETASIRELNQPNKTVFNSQSNSSDDFLLTAQGGLKGTSKPVYYRVRLNENACWGPVKCIALTRENLMSLSYQMCHKYGSASKSVRELPVIKYAKKLGNQVLSGLKYLREGVEVDGKKYVLEHPHDIVEEERDSRPFVRVMIDGRGDEKIFNLLQCDIHNHLAA